jgi:hypothetical protein
VQLELVIEFMRSFAQNGSGGARNFRPNAVARKKDNGLFHLCPWQKQQTQKRREGITVAFQAPPQPHLTTMRLRSVRSGDG